MSKFITIFFVFLFMSDANALYQDHFKDYVPPQSADAHALFSELEKKNTAESLYHAGLLFSYCTNQLRNFEYKIKTSLKNCRSFVQQLEKGRAVWNWLEKKAEAGDVHAMLYYAALPLDLGGIGSEIISNLEWLLHWKVRHVKFLERAVQKGSREAVRMLLDYYRNILEPPDLLHAAAWMRAYLTRLDRLDEKSQFLDPIYGQMSQKDIEKSIALSKELLKKIPTKLEFKL